MPSIATFAFNGTCDKDTNRENLLAGIDQAAAAGAQLVVFPEISLQGYPTIADKTVRTPTLLSVYANAEPIPDGQSVVAIAERAQRRGIHVVYGLTERGDRPGVVYNSAVLTGPAGHIGHYRKVHVASSERTIWQDGGEWPVFDTEIGRIGILICYDKVWPEATRELMLVLQP